VVRGQWSKCEAHSVGIRQDFFRVFVCFACFVGIFIEIIKDFL